MYAVIEDSGSQFKVEKDDIIRVDLRELPGDTTDITFDNVLMISDGEGDAKVGTPTVSGASVQAEVLTEVRGDKVTIIKMKRRKGYRRKRGHRQRFLRVRITDIKG